jgi:hypothetical protein
MIESSHLPALGGLKRARGFKSSRITKKTVIARARLAAGLVCFGAAAVALLTMTAVDRSFVAASVGCDGGGFTVLDLSGDQRVTVPAGSVPSSFLVKGKYIEFTSMQRPLAYATGRLPACRIRSI